MRSKRTWQRLHSLSTLACPWITAPETAAVFDALEAEGGPDCARFVGGCVRNALVGRPIDDIDIATTLTPDQVTEALEAADARGKPFSVDSLAFAPDGKRWLAAGSSGDVLVFDRSSRQLVKRLETGADQVNIALRAPFQLEPIERFAAALHLSADAMVSALAILGLAAGRWLGWTWADPLAGLAGATKAEAGETGDAKNVVKPLPQAVRDASDPLGNTPSASPVVRAFGGSDCSCSG